MSNSPILPLDFIEDVTNKTQFINHKLPVLQPNNIPVLTTMGSEEYWTKKGVQQFYNKGLMLGNGENNPDLESFLKQFRKVLEEIIRTELLKNEKTSETFKDDFKIIEHTYNNLIYKLKTDKTSTNNDRVLSTLHGFINSFVGSNHV
jgi:hypothetical protein